MKKLFTTLFLIPTISIASDLSASISFCEPGSQCKKCIETVQVSFVSDAVKSTVRLKGITTDKLPIDEPIANCKFVSQEDWECSSFRGTVSAVNGKLNYLRGERDLTIDGRQIEFCLNQI